MIISRWKGFEIDSSEGYYYFQNDMEYVNKGYDFMRRMLTSPLVWHQVTFTLVPLKDHEERVKELVGDYILKDLVKKIEHGDWVTREIENGIERYDYHDMGDGHLPSHIDPMHEAGVPTFLEIVEKLKNDVKLISVNFCIKPLKSLSSEERNRFRSWYLNQFENIKEGKSEWRMYCKQVTEDEIYPEGIIDDTSHWGPSYSFLGSFELYNRPPYSYRYIVPGTDPSLTLYLLSELLERFAMRFGGCHGISCNNSPDNLKLYKGFDPDDEKA